MDDNKINYGFVLKPKASDHFTFGAFDSLPKIVLQPDGQWDKYLPLYEPQAERFETYGCTVWGTQNALETLYKRLYGVEINADERYNYNCVGIEPPGADPHEVAESVRKDGLTFNLLPIPDTLEEFKTPRPMSDIFLDKGRAWNCKFGHEWVPTNIASMKEALMYSPLCISVSAWFQDADGLYIDGGMPNNHWCTLYGYTESEGKIYWKVFDSYNHSQKILHPAHFIQAVKRYHLERVEVKPTFWQRLLAWLRKLYEKST